MTAYYFLLIIFVLFNMAGFFLILLRTGDYDADMFTKIFGWLLFLPSLIGLFYYYQWVGLILFTIGLALTIMLKKTIKIKDKKQNIKILLIFYFVLV